MNGSDAREVRGIQVVKKLSLGIKNAIIHLTEVFGSGHYRGSGGGRGFGDEGSHQALTHQADCLDMETLPKGSNEVTE